MRPPASTACCTMPSNTAGSRCVSVNSTRRGRSRSVMGPKSTTRPPGRSRRIAANAAAKSWGPSARSDWIVTPSVGAATSISLNLSAMDLNVAFQSTATRLSFGTASWRSWTRLALSSAKLTPSPVTFPPGRARLATSPVATGSAAWSSTMGIVPVAALAVSVDCVAVVTITSTFSATSSAASSGRRSGRPPAPRNSIRTARPTTQPCSRSPSTSARSIARVSGSNFDPSPVRTPIRIGRLVDCASVARGASTRPSVAPRRKARRLVVDVLDEEDGVRDNDADHHDDPHEGRRRERRVREVERPEDADEPHRHREHDRERVLERLELGGEDHVDEDDREDRGEVEAREGLALLLGLAAQAEGEARGQRQRAELGLEGRRGRAEVAPHRGGRPAPEPLLVPPLALRRAP